MISNGVLFPTIAIVYQSTYDEDPWRLSQPYTKPYLFSGGALMKGHMVLSPVAFEMKEDYLITFVHRKTFTALAVGELNQQVSKTIG